MSDSGSWHPTLLVSVMGVTVRSPAWMRDQSGSWVRPWRSAVVECLDTLDDVDDQLLGEARQAQERLIDAERDFTVARAEFHHAVRRLHLRGASLRDIAAALGLSHQRVHQIVEAAGGSRRWRREHERYLDLACGFCGRPQPKVRKLIAGPGVYICEACVELAEGVLSSGSATTTPLGALLAVPEQDSQARCSFCGKRRHQVAGLAAMSAEISGEEATGPRPKVSGPAAICRECLSLCDEIIAEELA